MQVPRVRANLPVSPRVVAWLLAAAVLLVALLDGGSVLLTRLAVPDDALDAGHAAARAVEGLASTQQTTVVAFNAANQSATTVAMQIARDDFTVYPDGRVTLTASRTAPTLILHYLPVLRDFAVVSTTETVSALPYS